MQEKGKVGLIKFETTETNKVRFEYSVEHNNGQTSVEQKLSLTGETGFKQRWFANIELDQFPAQSTPKEAALKLADWLIRLGTTIQASDSIIEFSEPQWFDIKNDIATTTTEQNK